MKSVDNNRSLRLAESFGSRVCDLDTDLWSCIEETARFNPDTEAIVSMWQNDKATAASESSRCKRLTYGDMLNAVEDVAASLSMLVRGNDPVVAVVLGNSFEWAIFFLVCLKLKLTFAPLDPRGGEEVFSILSKLRPEVLVVHDADEARRFSSIRSTSRTRIHIQCSEPPALDWLGFSDFLGNAPTNTAVNGYLYQRYTVFDHRKPYNYQRTSLIVYSSGTTGTPRACAHTNRNLMSQTCDYDPFLVSMTRHRWLVHTPVSHIFAVNNALRAWRQGETVVFPSRTFDASSTLKALVEEKCTIMSATPTLVKSLIRHPEFPALERLCLSLVTIGATNIGQKDIALCQGSLGAEHAIQVYGTSEGAPILSWCSTDILPAEGYHHGAGKALPGTAVRICCPDTKAVLRRYELGELHISGSSIITNYYREGISDSFYDYGGHRWFNTGDAAMMDDHDVVHILGRYNDLINSGGKKINPHRIEAAMGNMPGLQICVVGEADEYMGEIPVAVINSKSQHLGESIEARARSLGPNSELGAVYTLEELGLSEFPVTSLGKIKRNILRDALQLNRNRYMALTKTIVRPQKSLQDQQGTIITLLDIWEQLTGVRPSSDERLLHISDSITLLRYCNSVFRQCGTRLYLQDVFNNGSVEQQAHILDLRSEGRRTTYKQNAPPPSVKYPSQLHDNYHTKVEHPNRITKQVQLPGFSESRTSMVPTSRFSKANKTASTEHASNKASTCGYDDPDREEVVPIRESFRRMVDGQRPNSYHVRLVFKIKDTTMDRVRNALEDALITRPIFRTTAFQKGGSWHHGIKYPSRKLFSSLIHEAEFETESEAYETCQTDTVPPCEDSHMFHARIMAIAKQTTIYLETTLNHSIIDALSTLSWMHDLDDAITPDGSRMSTQASQTPYSRFGNLHQEYESSTLAQNAVNFHVQRLRGISRFTGALWPGQKAPGWMIGDDSRSIHAQERNTVREQSWDGKWTEMAHEFRFPRVSRVVHLPQLSELRQQKGIEPVVFAKAAVALLNITMTGSTYAIFTTWESGRSWPFVPDWMQDILPPPMSIDGPTVEWVLNMTEVLSNETSFAFLERIKLEQQDMQNHQHAPWQNVLRELKDEAPVAEDASFRQAFVWDVTIGVSQSQGFQSDLKNLKPVARYDWPDCGLFWNAFMVDAESLCFVASWDTAQMNDVEMGRVCDELMNVMEKLGDERNWDKHVGGVFGI